MFNNILRKLSFAFAAGSLGGLANAIIVWLFGFLYITALLGVKISPEFGPSLIYPKIVWGGIWGALLLLPVFSKTYLIHGIVLSIAPTLIQLLIVFPSIGQGYLGLKLGLLTPIFVFIYNAVWGIVAVFFYQMVKRDRFNTL